MIACREPNLLSKMRMTIKEQPIQSLFFLQKLAEPAAMSYSKENILLNLRSCVLA
jgi:hypothetical protein